MKQKKPSYLYVIYLAIILVVVILFMLFLVNVEAPETSNISGGTDTYTQKLLQDRFEKDAKLVDSATSRFNVEERAMFTVKGLQYFDPDKDYRVVAEFVADTSTPVFQMPTTTERKPNYRIYGYLHFIVKDTLCKLTAYQNMDFKNSPAYDNTLFLPFMDNTNGLYTYGGGRYLDINIPESDTCILDFNRAYNPYCAYSARWSCPLVPFENDLSISILAGEKSYKKE
jgi:uncharacterized protein (DUF1684 family)